MEPGMARTQRLHVGPLVNTAAIQQDDDRAPEMSQQGAEEDGDFDMADVLVGMQVHVEAQAVTDGADGDRRDRGDLVAAIAVADDRGLPPSGPGPSDIWDQEEAALVGEDDMGLQALRVFFTAVHRYRFHRAMAASSRSNARRSGFWHDHPRRVSRRPTCARWSGTPNSRRITVAMRRVVQRSVSKPHAVAPRSKS